MSLLPFYPFLPRIFVSKLPATCTKEELINYFAKFGEIFSAKISKDKQKRSKGHGKVTFQHKEGLENALKARENLRVHGKKIKIEPFLSGNNLKEKEKLDSQTKVIVFDVRAWMNEGFLFKAFGSFGHIADVEIKDKGKRSKHAIITFSSPASASELTRIRTYFFEGSKFGVTLYNPNIPKMKSQRFNPKKNVDKNVSANEPDFAKIESKKAQPKDTDFRKKLYPSTQKLEFERKRGPLYKVILAGSKEIECFSHFNYGNRDLRFKPVSTRRRRKMLKKALRSLQMAGVRNDFSHQTNQG